jgi:dTDP-4-amino-4,6-dideoxygalactose transaminase
VPIPFLDLKVQYSQIREELAPVLDHIMENGAFIGGPEVASFEAEFAAFCGSPHCVGLNSGTDALRFALIAAGVGPGDEVITVPHTFIATTEAISQAGAVPVFVDIDPQTCTLDPARLQEFIERNCRVVQSTNQLEVFSEPWITPAGKAQADSKAEQPRSVVSTSRGLQRRPRASDGVMEPLLINHSTNRPVRAIVPVHLYGQTADMDPILALAREFRLTVVEDACQAHGALYKGRPAGSMGTAGCFSFYPGKNLGAFGDAGAVVTADEALAGRIRMLRDHGQSRKYYHDIEGYNGRLDAIQAAVLRLKLKRLAAWNRARRENAALYTQLLSDVPGVSVVREAPYAQSVYHLYVILTDDRDGLQQYLTEKGVGTGLHYPLPLHLQQAYASMGHRRGDFPVTERTAARLLSLPMYAELTREQIEFVVDCIKKYMEGAK